jgi:altronate hydrolase
MSASLTQAPAMLRLNSADNVLVSTRIVEKGETPAEHVTATARIMRGHKMAAIAIHKGEPIRKFGQIIGFSKSEILAGDWVHEHNVEMGELSHDYAFSQGVTPLKWCRRKTAPHSKVFAAKMAR